MILLIDDTHFAEPGEDLGWVLTSRTGIILSKHRRCPPARLPFDGLADLAIGLVSHGLIALTAVQSETKLDAAAEDLADELRGNLKSTFDIGDKLRVVKGPIGFEIQSGGVAAARARTLPAALSSVVKLSAALDPQIIPYSQTERDLHKRSEELWGSLRRSVSC